ncbi:HAD family hydrolase [Leifsonia bigeumensis]|uniref:HAD family hydrolase n=1 Tax=Leifsonella bigeumensis TaxID=433643 RepID=A0ABP7FP30_9MICO
MTSPTPAAVLWDMDGTLVDTEPYWMTAERDLVASFGGSWTAEDGLTLVGAGLWHSASILRGRGVDLDEQEIIDHLTERVLEQARRSIPWRPGARELLLELREAGIPTALVTMSMRPLAEHIANDFDHPVFATIVSGSDVEHSKPHPQPYLKAAAILGVDPRDCVAIEDSEPGLASATASGAVVIGVPAHVNLAPSPSYTLWPTLAGRTVADLGEAFAAHTSTAAEGVNR